VEKERGEGREKKKDKLAPVSLLLNNRKSKGPQEGKRKD